jgi:hypothetical protein
MAETIVEIWRKNRFPEELPTRFTVGEPPRMADGSPVDMPAVKRITLRQFGTISDKPTGSALYLVAFEDDAALFRSIPAAEVIDIGFVKVKPEKQVSTAPPLES